MNVKQKTKVTQNEQDNTTKILNTLEVDSSEYNVIKLNTNSFRYTTNDINLLNKVNYQRLDKQLKRINTNFKTKRVYDSQMLTANEENKNIFSLKKNILILYYVDEYKIILTGETIDDELEFDSESSFIKIRNQQIKSISTSEVSNNFIINDILILYKDVIDSNKLLNSITESIDTNIELASELEEEKKEKSGQMFQMVEEVNSEAGLSLNFNTYHDKDYKINHDLFYGKGFKNYYKQLVNKISSETHGITLFYGVEGGGKSNIIKRLCIDVENKAFIYLPNNFISEIGSPKFNYALTIIKNNLPGKNVVVVIEDADEYLINKDDGSLIKNSVLSSISSIADGILTEFYNIQFLLTFNYNTLASIPKMILRPNRLISVKKFNKLPIENCNKIFKNNKSKYITTEEMSLAEIFSKINELENSVLLEDLINNDNQIGFKQSDVSKGR